MKGRGVSIDAPLARSRDRRSAIRHRADNPDCLRGAFLIHRRMAAPHSTSHATHNPPPEPPAVSEALARAHQKYWRFNVTLIAALMSVGFAVSFLLPLAAPMLAHVRIAGFSLPFYFGAQGAILIYLALIVVYILSMQRADRRLQRAFLADADAAAAAVADANDVENSAVNPVNRKTEAAANNFAAVSGTGGL
jgi:putative solute:sodium symporter small subunit